MALQDTRRRHKSPVRDATGQSTSLTQAGSLNGDDGDEVTLMYAKHEKVPMKDFGSEVRASMDIAHFLSQATLVLDVVETSLEGITDLLLTKLLEKDEPLCSVAEAKSILFTHDTCKYPLTCMPLPFA
nr:uncharacterized protein LOC113829318 [Penaeus vannamei]